MTEKETKKPKKTHGFAFLAAVFAVIATAVVVLLNLMVSKLGIIWDMSPGKMYKLTDQTKKYLNSVDKTVNMYFLFDMDLLSTDTDSMPLYNALKEYSEFGCINFVSFDPEKDPDKTKELQEMGFTVGQGDIIVECEGRAKHIDASSMFETHTSQSSISSVYFSGENIITGAIESVVTGKEVKMYFLSGHGEKSLDTDYTILKTTLAAHNYIAESLDLLTRDSVPEDAAMIIVAAPRNDISDTELATLNKYLDNGGNICFWMSPNDAAVDYTNLESILKDYGIMMDYDIVNETDDELHAPNTYTTFLCSIVAAEQTDSIDLTSALREYTSNGDVPVMTDTRSFAPIYNEGNNMENVTVGSLLQTVDRVGDGSSTAVGEPCGGEKPRDRITDCVLDLSMFATDRARQNSKIMVMGNAEFMDDENFNNALSTITKALQLTVFSWMYDSDQDLNFGIASKQRSFDEMQLSTQSKATGVNVLFIAVPIGVGLIGGIVWLRRRYSE